MQKLFCCRSVFVVFCISYVLLGVIIVSYTALNIPGVWMIGIVAIYVLYDKDMAAKYDYFFS